MLWCRAVGVDNDADKRRRQNLGSNRSVNSHDCRLVLAALPSTKTYFEIAAL